MGVGKRGVRSMPNSRRGKKHHVERKDNYKRGVGGQGVRSIPNGSYKKVIQPIELRNIGTLHKKQFVEKA